MFELLKKDIKIGNKVNLHLINGNESGVVIEIGDNYILLQSENGTKHRFFDKLIGGWEILSDNKQNIEDEKKHSLISISSELQVSIKAIVDKLKEINIEAIISPNTQISTENYNFLISAFSGTSVDEIIPDLDIIIQKLIELEDKSSPITDSEIWQKFMKYSGRKISRDSVTKSRKRLGFAHSNLRKENSDNFSSEFHNNSDISNTLHENIDEVINLNIDLLLDNSNLLKESLPKNILSKFIAPNANIIEVRGTTCIASNNNNPSIFIHNNRIVGSKLLSELETFQAGSIIPVVLSSFEKNGVLIVNSVVLPSPLENYIDELIVQIKESNFEQVLLVLSIIRNEVKTNRHLAKIIVELSKKYNLKNIKEPKNILVSEITNVESQKNYKNVEKEINDLIRQSKFEFALKQIEKELDNNSIEEKYKSSLLLKKGQIFSSLNKPEESEKAYEDLVNFNEKTKASASNLSHLYTELARLQALIPEKQLKALSSVKKALDYNQNNNYALNLLRQFEGKATKNDFPNSNDKNIDGHIIIDNDDDSTTISKMIDLDIREHKYTHPDIIRNGGKPTAFIAKSILDEAKKTKEIDLSERYPIYLEAAKSFSELNVGSYDLQDYLEAVAYYSMLKGNSLFINFRNNISNGELTVSKLTRLRDSACSYYIESLNLLSNIEPNLLVNILANYLKLNLTIYHLNFSPLKDYKELLKGNFGTVFKNCIKSNDTKIESIAYKVVVDCGASSINAWNRLSDLPNGTSILYADLKYSKRRIEIFDLINSIEENSINTELKPGEFFKNTFFERRNNVKSFFDNISNLLNINLEPHNIESLIKTWQNIDGFHRYITPTDEEIKSEIDNLLSILLPYLNRSDKERLNILIQIRNVIEKQIKFINDNTTYYGRTFFYALFNKWKRDVDLLLQEKIAQSYPSLSISIDPPYFINTDGEITAPLVIKNEGEATAEGFELKIIGKSSMSKEGFELVHNSDFEIAAQGKIETSFVIPPQLLKDSTAIEIKIEIQSIYQKKKLSIKSFEFTIENEPESTLTYDDIPWRDGPIPPEDLFKGRKKLIADLAQHYLSVERDKPYILYGLTRTGKSSVLTYLKKDIEGDSFISKGTEKTILTFSWDLSEAASFKNVKDFWEYILMQQTYDEIVKYSSLYDFDYKSLKINENVKAKDFRVILDFLKSKNLYPIFFIDEFSFIKTLIDEKIINNAFLHSLRQFSMSDLASFIFAGTYDIKSLIKDSKYGITGQLVNAIEEQVNEISDESSRDLIKVINDKLSFTPEAIKHIIFLSGNVPYFIQIICKNCGYYASENKRRFIGYPELEKVIRILIGQEESSQRSLIKKLTENTFQNNQLSPTDPKEVAVLLSSIAYFNKGRVSDPRGVGFSELQKLWADKKINAFRPKLAEAINLLKEKKIIIQDEDEGMPVYKLSVDLFRRFWENFHPDINLTLTTLTE